MYYLKWVIWKHPFLNHPVHSEYVYFKNIFCFSITIYFQYYFILVSGVHHSGQTLIYFTKWSVQYFQYPPGTRHGYHSITDYIPYAVLMYICLSLKFWCKSKEVKHLLFIEEKNNDSLENLTCMKWP